MPNGTYWWCERGEKISPTRFRFEPLAAIAAPLQWDNGTLFAPNYIARNFRRILEKKKLPEI